MTQEELQKENEKLNARLQKAVSVFNEQKATIARLTEERDAALAKTSDADKQDQLFFEQEQEINQLKEQIKEKDVNLETINVQLNTLSDMADKAIEEHKKAMEEKDGEIEKLNGRIKKAGEEYSKQKQALEVALAQNQAAIKFIIGIQDSCSKTIQAMSPDKNEQSDAKAQ